MIHDDPIHWDAGDHHSWVRPPGPDCLDCECCTARLCTTAAARGLPCTTIGAGGPGVMDLTRCPCAALAAARRLLARVPAADPSHPDRAGTPGAAVDTDKQYRHRNALLLAAARKLRTAGVPVGITRDPTNPHPIVLTIDLRGAGQVTWHLPDQPDGYGLAPAAPWDGHDTRTKYARLAAWMNPT